MSTETPLQHSYLRLNTPANTRKTLARIIRLFARGEISGDLYKGLVYGLNVLLGAWKQERDEELQRRIENIEELLSE